MTATATANLPGPDTIKALTSEIRTISASIQAMGRNLKPGTKTALSRHLGQLHTSLLRYFIGELQWTLIRQHALVSEEAQFFTEKICHVAETIAAMPATGDTEGQGMNATIHLHYFMKGCDLWISERDAGDPDDEVPGQQSQAFGLTSLGYGAELGYTCLRDFLDAGAELDLHWKPVTLAEIMKNHR